MRLLRIALVAAFLIFMSCVPKYTIYLDLGQTIGTSGIVVLNVDTVKVAGQRQKRIEYAMTRDMGSLDYLFLSRRIKKNEKKIDKMIQKMYITRIGA